MARSPKSTSGQAPKPKAFPGGRKRCQMADLDLIQTSTYVNYLGSTKIASHLDHTSHCQASLGTNRSKRCPDTPKPCRPLPALGGSTTLHPTPSTLHPQPYTLQTYTLHSQPYTQQPYTFHPRPYTLKSYTLNPTFIQPYTLHPQPYTLKSYTLHPHENLKHEIHPRHTLSLTHTFSLSLSLSLSLSVPL